MAETFTIFQGANKPSLITYHLDENNVPIDYNGTVVLRLKHDIHGSFDYETTILAADETYDYKRIRVDDLGLKPSTTDLMTPAKYKAQWRYTDENGDLTILPTEASPYDTPIYDMVVIQKAL